jgi:hypothetical protein
MPIAVRNSHAIKTFSLGWHAGLSARFVVNRFTVVLVGNSDILTIHCSLRVLIWNEVERVSPKTQMWNKKAQSAETAPKTESRTKLRFQFSPASTRSQGGATLKLNQGNRRAYDILRMNLATANCDALHAGHASATIPLWNAQDTIERLVSETPVSTEKFTASAGSVGVMLCQTLLDGANPYPALTVAGGVGVDFWLDDSAGSRHLLAIMLYGNPRINRR